MFQKVLLYSKTHVKMDIFKMNCQFLDPETFLSAWIFFSKVQYLTFYFVENIYARIFCD